MRGEKREALLPGNQASLKGFPGCLHINELPRFSALGHPPTAFPPTSTQHTRSIPVTCGSHTAITRLPASWWSLWALHGLRPWGLWEELSGRRCPHWTTAHRVHAIRPGPGSRPLPIQCQVPALRESTAWLGTQEAAQDRRGSETPHTAAEIVWKAEKLLVRGWRPVDTHKGRGKEGQP